MSVTTLATMSRFLLSSVVLLTAMGRAPCSRAASFSSSSSSSSSSLLVDATQTQSAFGCPPCSTETLSRCPTAPPWCPELAREPGCGCCVVCAARQGEACGVYTPRCGMGLRCYPRPGEERPLHSLVRGRGICTSSAKREANDTDKDEEASSADVASDVDGAGAPPAAGPAQPQPLPLPARTSNPDDGKSVAVHRERVQKQGQERRRMHNGSREGGGRSLPQQQQQQQAGRQHANLRPNALPEGSANPRHVKPWGRHGPCLQELEAVVEKIERLQRRSREERVPLEELYLLYIPNCSRDGLYHAKQCRTSLSGQRGECWCVHADTGVHAPGSPVVRGDLDCAARRGPETPNRK